MSIGYYQGMLETTLVSMVGMLSNTYITTYVNVREKSGDNMYFWLHTTKSSNFVNHLKILIYSLELNSLPFIVKSVEPMFFPVKFTWAHRNICGLGKRQIKKDVVLKQLFDPKPFSKFLVRSILIQIIQTSQRCVPCSPSLQQKN